MESEEAANRSSCLFSLCPHEILSFQRRPGNGAQTCLEENARRLKPSLPNPFSVAPPPAFLPHGARGAFLRPPGLLLGSAKGSSQSDTRSGCGRRRRGGSKEEKRRAFSSARCFPGLSLRSPFLPAVSDALLAPAGDGGNPAGGAKGGATLMFLAEKRQKS